MEKIQQIDTLVKQLNIYSDAYYNRLPLISDEVYDKMYDKLEALENETGYVLSNSPTKRVGFEVLSKLNKVKHKNRLYSLGKTKDIANILTTFGDIPCISSLKLDGLTTVIEYKEGKLFRASTRGDGFIGEDITHAVKVYRNIPLTLKEPVDITVVGESVIKIGDFNNFNNKLDENDRFKNPRNAVSGTVRNLNSVVVKTRSVRFIAFDIIESTVELDTYLDTLDYLGKLGFNTVPNVSGHSLLVFEQLRKYANMVGFGIDGIVIRINDNKLYNEKGFNSKFPLGAKAFKFQDECEETVLTNIEWSIGRTGVLTPVAVFEPVELEGTTVERASLHNISHIERLGLGGIGSIVSVQKSNQIIPQIVEVIEPVGESLIPTVCPYCGCDTDIKEDNSSKILICSNEDCTEKLVMSINHYASRSAMNIRGLSEQNIRAFIKHGLISNISDIYSLNEHVNYIKKIDGFGDKSAKAIIENIESSRNTTLERFIYALGIPTIGLTVSKDISNKTKTLDKLFSLSLEQCVEICGDVKGTNLYNYKSNNAILIMMIANNLNIEVPVVNTSNVLDGIKFCVTGSCVCFSNRANLKSFIESRGGIVTTSVTSNTDYLICNEVEDSTKYKKAKSLNIKIISEQELLNIVK